MVSKAIDAPGCAFSRFVSPLLILTISVTIGVQKTFPSLSCFLPGLISILSPALTTPCFRAPPNTPPRILLYSTPGLLISKLLAMNIIGSLFKSLTGVLKVSSMVCIK